MELQNSEINPIELFRLFIVKPLDSNSYEDAVRNAISLGGDSDTLACITGGIAEAYYGTIAPCVLDEVKERLTSELWQITEEFCCAYKS
jgi:ADP-ribosylglycohydrolase